MKLPSPVEVKSVTPPDQIHESEIFEPAAQPVLAISSPPSESAPPPESGPRLPPDYPPNPVIVAADKDGNNDHQMKGEPFMWTWIDAKRWYYVKDYPVPVFGK
jgi:hypothetical protein